MSKEFNIQNFKSIVKVNVRYDDLDTLGHVNNKTYLSYLEESRIKYVTDVFGFDGNSLNFDIVVGRIDIKYLQAVFLNDDVSVYTRISRIGKKSYDFECYIVKKIDNIMQIAASAVVTMVSVNMKTGKTKLNEQDKTEAVLNYESIKPEFSSNRF